MPIDAVVLDVEGTTTSIGFVTDVLYPFARERLPNFVRRHRDEPEVVATLNETREAGGGVSVEAVVELMCQWMDRDQKVTPLKALQGLIWEEGNRIGELVTHLFPDRPGTNELAGEGS